MTTNQIQLQIYDLRCSKQQGFCVNMAVGGKLSWSLTHLFSAMYMIVIEFFFGHFSNVQVNTNLGTSLHEHEDHPPFGPLSHILHHSVVSCSSRTTSSATPSWAIPYVNSNTYMSRDSPNFLKSGKNIKKMRLQCLYTNVNENPYILY